LRDNIGSLTELDLEDLTPTRAGIQAVTTRVWQLDAIGACIGKY
jgi:hypothetical protein